jgi:hypothetical protein
MAIAEPILNVELPHNLATVAVSGTAVNEHDPARSARLGNGLFTSTDSNTSTANAIVVQATRQKTTNAIAFFMSTSSVWLKILPHPSVIEQSILSLSFFPQHAV